MAKDKTRVFTSLFIIVVIQQLAATSNLPPFIKTCKLTDPDISDCVKKSIDDGMNELSKGYPKVGMIQLEPLQIDKVDIPADNGPIKMRQLYTDTILSGIQNMKMAEFHINPETLDMKFSFTGDFKYSGNYEISGQMLVVPISGNGKFEFELGKANISHVGKAEIFEKKGQKHMKFKEYKSYFNALEPKMNYDNLFGDKKLSDGMNKFINDHIDEIFPEIKKPFEKSFALIFQELCNRLFAKVPLAELFPEDKERFS